MGKLKNAALVNAPLPVRKASPRPPASGTPPLRFLYALAAYSAERRANGWYIARTAPSAVGKTEWAGPFETIETAVLAIGRRLATEIADRHTRSIEAHKIKPGDPLHGLKRTTRLRRPGRTKDGTA